MVTVPLISMTFRQFGEKPELLVNVERHSPKALVLVMRMALGAQTISAGRNAHAELNDWLRFG